MNQGIRTQLLINSVGATLAVALLKHEPAFSHPATNQECRGDPRGRPAKARTSLFASRGWQGSLSPCSLSTELALSL